MFSLIPRVAAAQRTPFASLTIEGGAGRESCVTESGVREAVATAIGFDPFVSGTNQGGAEARLMVRVLVTRGRRSLRVDVALREPHSADWIEFAPIAEPVQQCQTLLRVIAAQLRLELQARVPREPEPSRQPVVVSSPVPAPPLRAEFSTPLPRPVAPAPPAERVRLFGCVGGLLSYERLPSLAPGFLLGVVASYRWLALGAEVRWDPTTASGSTRADFEASTLGGGLLLCALPHSRWWVCAVGYVGMLQAKSLVDLPDDAREDVYSTLGGRFAHVVPVTGPIHIRFFAEISFPLNYVRAAVAGVPQWVTPVAQGAIGVALDATIL